jgi:hypothetical protein
MPRLLVHVTTLLAALLLVGFAVLAVRGMLDPATASANFGIAAEHPDAAAYQLVYRSRNLVIAVTGLLFLLLGMWRALAILTTACIFLPAFDIALLVRSNVPVNAIHTVTLVALAIVAGLLWWRSLQPRPGAPVRT